MLYARMSRYMNHFEYVLSDVLEYECDINEEYSWSITCNFFNFYSTYVAMLDKLSQLTTSCVKASLQLMILMRYAIVLAVLLKATSKRLQSFLFVYMKHVHHIAQVLKQLKTFKLRTLTLRAFCKRSLAIVIPC